LEAEQ
jgi:hypothetical protein